MLNNIITGRKELGYRTSKLLKGKEGKREKIIYIHIKYLKRGTKNYQQWLNFKWCD